MTNKRFLILRYSNKRIAPEKFYTDTLINLQKRYLKSSFLSIFEWKKDCYKWCFALCLNDFYHLDSICFGDENVCD